jgi:hypothetical protein
MQVLYGDREERLNNYKMLILRAPLAPGLLGEVVGVEGVRVGVVPGVRLYSTCSIRLSVQKRTLVMHANQSFSFHTH